MTDATTPAEIPQPAVEPAPVQTGPKVKTRMPFQRACNEKDAKGKLCAGHLKRWYAFGDDIKRQVGPDAEVYRCEHCHTIYLPTPGFQPRTGTLQF
jgi:hypothetical protein